MVKLASLIAAVGYIRMSSKKQDKSPEQQKAEIIKLAKGKYRIVRWYQDSGRSGGKEIAKREEFLRMISDAEQLADFKAILSWNKLRFDRMDIYEGAEFKMRLRDCGVYLHTVADGLIDWSSDVGQMQDTFLSMKGNKDLTQMAQDVIRGKLDAVNERGRILGGSPPYGMCRQVTDEKGKVTIIPRGDKFRSLPDWEVKYIKGDPDEMSIVEWLFTTFDKKDVSPYWLAGDLNKRGIPSPSGVLWRDLAVRRMLAERSYIGDYEIGKKRTKEAFYRITKEGAIRNIGPRGRAGKSSKGKEEEKIIKEGLWEGVIDPALFWRVQKKLEALKDSGRKPRAADAGYPLSGILHCGHCGKRLLGGKKKLKDSEVIRYHCGGFMNNPSGQCEGWKIDQHEIIQRAIDKLRETITPERIADLKVRTESPSADRSSAIRKQVAKIEASIEKGNRRICDIDNDRVAKGILAELETLYSEKDQLEAELASLLNPVDVEAVVTDWWNRLQEEAQKPKGKGEGKIIVAFNPAFFPKLALAGQKIGDLSGIDPLTLRRAFTEIGLRLDCFWKLREIRTREGKFQLERVELSVDLGKLRTHSQSDRSRSTLH